MVEELVQEDKEWDVVICQIKGDLQEIVKFWLVGWLQKARIFWLFHLNPYHCFKKFKWCYKHARENKRNIKWWGKKEKKARIGDIKFFVLPIQTMLVNISSWTRVGRAWSWCLCRISWPRSLMVTWELAGSGLVKLARWRRFWDKSLKTNMVA